MGFRVEHDYLGEVRVPADAYWGVQTQRAVQNFPISGIRPSKEYIVATATVKRAAAEANLLAGRLDRRRADAIMKAAEEIMEGRLQDQFVVDVYQAGAGTSHNMNANEVIANRALEILGERRGSYDIVSPNDHVNMGQSTNDVIPTIIRVVSLTMLKALLGRMEHLSSALHLKAEEFDGIIKSGRTHLMDAAPIRLGQEFEAWARMISRDAERLSGCEARLAEMNIGATAVGTGLNADPRYVEEAVKVLCRLTGFRLRNAGHLPEMTQSTTDFVDLSGGLRALAVDLIKISNDIRLMASGPKTGLAEIELPAVQPGSSIMPGKVNPSIPEMVDMVGFQVIGNDTAITLASQAGQLELNVMMPLIAYCLVHSMTILRTSCEVFADKAVAGIRANRERMEKLLHESPGVALALNPYVGYLKAAEVVKKALAENKTVKDAAIEMKLLPREELERIFDPHELTKMGIAGSPSKRRSKR
ncbi:MAG: aspartate ammonia-lyase [Nitrososphaerota archaeon]|nr:aspartate ammonia-lyase [Nitrososphaerota archaeon]MDG6939908.1 aspartate ammonia-lyase [Nitrososphaerota archaeon]